ncbi:MAG: hypothetical protein ACP5MC_01310 [Candidatus Micrarchaeia archaeon]
MKLSDSKSGYLTSRISVKLRLLSSLESIEHKLRNYPGMLLASRGTSLKYVIDQQSDHFYTFEIAKDRAELVIFSRQTPLFYMQEALLRLMNLLLIVKDCEVEIESIFPYIIAILARQQISGILASAPNNRHDAKMQTDVDFLLAKRIKELLKENTALKQTAAETKAKLEQITLQLVVASSAGTTSIKELASRTKLSELDLKSAIAQLPKLGYKAVYKNSDSFELVSL